jgi:predicted DNA-binding transcriptional regulator AlpA
VQDIEAIKVLNRRDAIKHLGVSERSFQRLEARGDGPPKTRLSKGRIGYRVSDIREWLDARREAPSSRDMVDSWQPLGEAAKRATKHL